MLNNRERLKVHIALLFAVYNNCHLNKYLQASYSCSADLRLLVGFGRTRQPSSTGK